MLDDIDIRGIKTGMLLDSDIISAVASTLKEVFAKKGAIPLVCDPVSVSTSGHVLLLPDAVDAMIEKIFPLACLITPNKAEAELLLRRRGFDCTINTLQDMIIAVQNLSTFGAEAVLLKGGHITLSLSDLDAVVPPEDIVMTINQDSLLENNIEIFQEHNEGQPKRSGLVVDVLYVPSEGIITLYPRPRLVSSSTHGTGCTLSAALACAVGREIPCEHRYVIRHNLLTTNVVDDATAQATSYTHLGIETAASIGHGFGPLNHLHSITKSLVPP